MRLSTELGTHGDGRGGAARRDVCRRVAARRRRRREGGRRATTAWSAPRRRRAPRTGPTAEAKSAGCSSCHTDSDAHDHAPLAGGGARLHRLPWRQPAVRGDPDAAARRLRPMSRRATRPMCCRAIPGAWHWPSSANPRAQLHPAQPRGARIRPLRQPVRLSRRARYLRRLPYRDDRGGRALADGDRRDAVGRRRLQ